MRVPDPLPTTHRTTRRADHRRITAWALPLALALAAPATTTCAPPPRPLPAQDATLHPDRAPYDSAAHTGELTVRVSLDGIAPQPRQLAIGGDDLCVAGWREAGGAMDPRFEVGDDGTLPHVVVFATKGPHTEFGYRPDQSPSAGLVVRQRRCVYEPHVFGVMQQQTFDVVNDDATVHNVRTMPRVNTGSNFSQQKGARDVLWFGKPEHSIYLECNVHTWMSAVAFAFDHPFFGVSDADGTLVIRGLPDGRYEFSTWHETFAPTTFEVVITDGAATSHDVSLTTD